MSRTSASNPGSRTYGEIIKEYLTGYRLAAKSKGPAIYINEYDAGLIADALVELLPKHSSGAKAWVGYSLDRMRVVANGTSKSEVKEKWMTDAGVTDSSLVRTVYSASGIYRFSYTAPDLSSYDVWIVQAGTEGFGPPAV